MPPPGTSSRQSRRPSRRALAWMLAQMLVLSLVVGGAAFAGQALLLPRPKPAQTLAAAVAGRLFTYDTSAASERIGGRVFRAVCRDERVPVGPDGMLARGDLLRVEPGHVQLVDALGKVQVLSSRERGLTPTQLLLAGCPHTLGERLRHNLSARSLSRQVTAGGARLLRLVARREYLELVLAPGSLLPMRMEAFAHGRSGESTLRYTRVEAGRRWSTQMP
jgi:hypothetical protein